MKYFKSAVLSLAVLAVCGVLPAQAKVFELDPHYTFVVFKIRHIVGYSVGSFKKVEGTISVDDKKDEISAVDVTIDVASLETDQPQRDDDLRSERFFDTKQFPLAMFKADKITKNKIIGDLTLHGVTRKVTLEYEYFGQGQDQYGNTKMALSARGEVNRKDFGIKYNQKTDDGNWLLGDDVELMIEAQGIIWKEPRKPRGPAKR